MLFLQLFWTFFQIGLLGFGGGYAMISMIQSEVVVSHHWLTTGQFTDIVAISQMTPGPVGINMATYVGYTSVVNAGYAPWVGVLGSALATLSVVFPSFVLMLAISKFLMRYKSHPVVEDVFRGLRPAVVGLLMAAALCLMQEDNFSSPAVCPWQFWVSVGVCVFAVISRMVYSLNPIAIIVIGGVVGLLLL
ncbi:MAG: chromate transporter [Bacteroidaceae bacterium]|nr:chromate transporter [Bacteroidaceae bacterium]